MQRFALPACLITMSVALIGGVVRAEESKKKAEDVKPLKAGDKMPKIALRDADDKTVDLNKAVAEKPAVLIYYRGGWCPYCNRQLSSLSEIVPKLNEIGLRILAISPDSPAKIRQSLEQKHGGKLPYQLLSDTKMESAKAFGIEFYAATNDRSKKRLKEYSGQDHGLLPVPSVFIVDQKGVIRFAYSNPDYRVRLEPEKIIAAAAKVKKVEN